MLSTGSTGGMTRIARWSSNVDPPWFLEVRTQGLRYTCRPFPVGRRTSCCGGQMGHQPLRLDAAARSPSNRIVNAVGSREPEDRILREP